MFFEIRKAKKTKKVLDALLWPNQVDSMRPIARTTGWRIIKWVLDAAGIKGPQATTKGLRHGYAVAMVMVGLNVRILQKRLGHESAGTTAIYLQVGGDEAHTLEERAWKKANENWSR